MIAASATISPKPGMPDGVLIGAFGVGVETGAGVGVDIGVSGVDVGDGVGIGVPRLGVSAVTL